MDTYLISEDSVALLLPGNVMPDVGKTVGLLLRMAKLGALYPRDRRDSIILFAISNGFTLPQTNELLFSHSMNGLSK